MLDSRSGSILRVWAGRVYEIVCFRDRWLVKPAPTIAQIIQLTALLNLGMMHSL